jgi:hypothetical protein
MVTKGLFQADCNRKLRNEQGYYYGFIVHPNTDDFKESAPNLTDKLYPSDKKPLLQSSMNLANRDSAVYHQGLNLLSCIQRVKLSGMHSI